MGWTQSRVSEHCWYKMNSASPCILPPPPRSLFLRSGTLVIWVIYGAVEGFAEIEPKAMSLLELCILGHYSNEHKQLDGAVSVGLDFFALRILAEENIIKNILY